MAAQNGRSSIVNLLLERNAMVNQPAKDGTTPLAIAAKVGAGECAEALLSYGANVNHPNKGMSFFKPPPIRHSSGSPSWVDGSAQCCDRWTHVDCPDAAQGGRQCGRANNWYACCGLKKKKDTSCRFGRAEGKTALDLATENNHDDCVSLLQYATDKAGHAPTSSTKTVKQRVLPFLIYSNHLDS